MGWSRKQLPGLEEIFPSFRVPKLIGSDNGSVFVSKVSQKLTEILRTNWKHYWTYYPQGSRQVEKINKTLWETLTKLTLETGSGWVVPLPLFLNSLCHFNLTTLEILFDTPTPLESTGPSQEVFHDMRFALNAPGMPETPHCFQIGDWICIRRLQELSLEPWWKKPSPNWPQRLVLMIR